MDTLIDWHWKWPVFLASCLLLVLLGAAFGVHAIFVDGPIVERGQGTLRLGPHFRTDFVLVSVTAFTLGAGLASLAKAAQEFDRLRHILQLDDTNFDVYRARLFPNARAMTIAGLIGGSIDAALDLSQYIHGTIRQGHPSMHSLLFMILLFGLLGVMSLITHHQSQVFREVGRQHVRFDLLDPGALSPFAAVGLMNAGAWFIGSAIASLLMASTADVGIVVTVIVVTMGFGIAGLIVPSRGLHAHIRARKREELAEIRRAIANERAALFSAAERSLTPPAMHAMLAYISNRFDHNCSAND